MFFNLLNQRVLEVVEASLLEFLVELSWSGILPGNQKVAFIDVSLIDELFVFGADVMLPEVYSCPSNYYC